MVQTRPGGTSYLVIFLENVTSFSIASVFLCCVCVGTQSVALVFFSVPSAVDELNQVRIADNAVKLTA